MLLSFSDVEFEQNKASIDAALAEIMNAVTDSIRMIVIPSDGLGTGRAQLDRRAPRTFAYLQNRINGIVSK